MLLAKMDEGTRQHSLVSGELDRVKGLHDSLAKTKLGLKWSAADELLFTTGVHPDEHASKRHATHMTDQHD